MNKLEISLENALNAYNGTDEKGKQMLRDLFGEETFSGNIMKRVKTFNDILGLANMTMEDLLPYANPKNGRQRWHNAVAKVELIVDVLNEKWEAAWNNKNQKKWWVWCEWNGSAFGFLDTVYDGSGTRTRTGSRLCFASSELAEFAAKQFPEIWNEFLTKTK